MSLNIGKKWRVLGVIGALFVPAMVTAALSLPFSFKAGDPIKSAEVNANFEALRSRLDALSGGTPTRQVVGTLTLPGVVTETPIRSFAQSISIAVSPGSGLGGGAGGAKPTLSDVQLVRDAGEGTPPLNLILNQQKHLTTADIVVGNLSVHLTDVIVSRVAVTGTQAGRAQETIGLYYSTIQWTWQVGKGAAKVVSFDRTKGVGEGASALPASFAYFPPSVPADAEYVPISGYTHEMACATPPCKVTHGNLTLQKLVGSETLDTLSVAALSKHTAALELTWFTSATAASHSLKLTDVQVASVSLATNDDGSLSESDAFSYSTITWIAGKTQNTWDLTKNTGL